VTTRDVRSVPRCVAKAALCAAAGPAAAGSIIVCDNFFSYVTGRNKAVVDSHTAPPEKR